MFSHTKSLNSKPIAHDFNKIIYLNDDREPNSIKTNNEFHLMPRNDGERELIYITGSSGCGKTTFIKNYCELYHKIYPKSPIYLFSEKLEDPSIDILKYINRIIIDENINEIAEIPLENYLPNTLLLFDDYDDLQKQYLTPIQNLISRVLKLGRQYKISAMIVSHLINPTKNREFNRNILMEVQKTIFFKNDNTYGNKYYLKTYGGMDKKQIDNVLSKDTRYIIFNNRYPNYFITKKEIFTV
jgi:energy-coupling factor transporter ATP-binding protein EcfA2